LGGQPSGKSPKLALEPRRGGSTFKDMGIRVAVALWLASVLAAGGQGQAQGPGDQKGENPDAAAPLLVSPSGASAAEPAPGAPGLPPPRALDSKRTPMPDRLSDDHWLQYFPEAPPTPYVPNSGAATGGGANRVNNIFTGGAPIELPGESVTRTPEDQLPPPSPPATRTP
jgi:hypothetical protein